MHIIGTAGHVDHGKSSLVAALTGTNPDRWVEEQLRGMTLDLGFAHLPFDDGIEAGIVDVPGHERFLHNMLAGASGMDVLLLVVAANEGVMPQTIEHLQILQFLNVRSVVVALTKIDLVEPALRGEACRSLHAALRETIARDAPIFAVSTVTGDNLDVLREGLHVALQALDARDAQAPAYLPVDRVFTLAGRGTIVTGTLMQGRIAVGDTVALEPGGRQVRVRSLQVFGAARESASGGTRVAINLAGVERHDLGRGHAVVDPHFSARSQIAVYFRALPDALPLLRRRTPVRVHVGSAEVLGTLVFDGSAPSTDGARAQLFLREPVLAFPGVRFVARRVSPKTLLGGGEVLDAAADAPSDHKVDAADDAVLRALGERGAVPATASELAFSANLREDVADRALARFVETGDAVRIARPDAYLSAAAANALLESVLAQLRELHDAAPWAMGLTSIALARAVAVPEPDLVRILQALVTDGRLAYRGGYYAALDHVPRLSSDQRAFFETHVRVDSQQPFVPANADEVTASLKRSGIAGIDRALETLLARGVLVRVGDALYRGTQISEIHTKVERYLDERERMTMAEFRDLLGTSRKYAVPLLEWFDGRGITVRSGDYRMLRSRRGAKEATV